MLQPSFQHLWEDTICAKDDSAGGRDAEGQTCFPSSSRRVQGFPGHTTGESACGDRWTGLVVARKSAKNMKKLDMRQDFDRFACQTVKVWFDSFPAFIV